MASVALDSSLDAPLLPLFSSSPLSSPSGGVSCVGEESLLYPVPGSALGAGDALLKVLPRAPIETEGTPVATPATSLADLSDFSVQEESREHASASQGKFFRPK